MVYSDGLVCAFMDIQPVNPGHVLVIPREHHERLSDLPEETGASLFRAGQRIAGALGRSGIRCEGTDFFLADGEAAWQEVFHIHLHVFPRFADDGFGLRFAQRYYTRPPRAELEEVASLIRNCLEEDGSS
jgi:histidine triad (HIT) family protein